MLTILKLAVLNDNYIYLIHDPVSGETAAVDPAIAAPVIDALNQHGWTLTVILNTHHHNDHVGANLALKQKTGCRIIAGVNDRHRIPGIDTAVKEHDVISLGKHPIHIIDTPGHTNGHIVYYFVNDDLLFCGDTLFVMGCGRLFEGHAEQLWHSLQKLKALPASTHVYCAHEYTQANARFALSVEPDNQALQQRVAIVDQLRAKHEPTVPSTIAQEWATNPFFREDSPALQATIGMSGKKPVDVFTQLRKLKDAY